jgi:RNA polymerase sigma-70 factor (ECF subfamily)
VSARGRGSRDAHERANFTAFFSAYHPAVYAWLLRKGASHADAEDLAQETMLRTWRERHNHETPEHARRFVYTVASTALIDLCRRADRQVAARPDFDDVVLGSAACPSDEAVRSEQRRALGAALGALPAADRALLIDSEVHGMTTEELAERYQGSLGALRIRWWRSRQVLRGLLDS